MVERKADRIGEQLGPYRLTRLLGAGGFGEVYEADHRLLQQKRAVKLLLERHFHDSNQHERFLREARTLATLDHPNILPVLEVREEGPILYLVMPFYRRGSLNDLLKQRTTPLPLVEVERLLAQMCAAVGYSHTRNIVHLDLKPENMLLHEDGQLVLSDFGLAHLIKQGRLEAGSSASWGTPYYMAPEHIRGEPEPRSDLYALGVILYRLLANQLPFTGATPEAVIVKHLLEPPPPLHAASPAIPAPLEPVLRKALEKQPEDRYPTAEALLADFRAAVSSPSPQSIQLAAPGVTPVAPMPRPKRSAPVLPERTQMPPELVSRIIGPANVTKATTAVCEIELKDGHNCSVTAIGRCSTCGRAFCPTHQAWSGQTFYIDRCAPCLAKERADAEEAREYFQSDLARNDLLTSRVRSVNIYQVEKRLEIRGIFRQRDEWVDVVTSTGHGWILGEFEWQYVQNSSWEGKWESVVRNYLTALLDVSPDAKWFRKRPHYLNNNGTLVRVRPYSGGYAVLPLREEDRFQGGRWWIAAEQAVRRLTGSSS